ncbi:MAG TPA: sodium:proton antiporter [Bacteroidales bacterium]|nr:sodium:proton antiporter [Bacteroidales bacterium]
MSLYDTFSIFIVLAALFAYVNYRFVRLPSTIGLMIIAIITSLLMIATGKFFPVVMKDSISILHNFDFSELLLGSMLSFILFAGAIHVNAKELRHERFSILTYSSLGILLSTFIIGTVLYYLLPVFKLHVPWLQCLLFGILISPTDPIAVLAILKKAGIKKSTEIKITGESLFNDGVAVVIFMTILTLARHTEEVHWINVGWLFIREAGGGLLLGILIGYGSYLLMRSIDNYKVEVLLSVAVVMGGYTIADRLEVSGPLAMVAAGIMVGNKGRRQAMSDTTWNYISSFWELIDEIMNAILFVLIGLELLIIPFDINYLVIGSVTILIALSSRYISVWLPGQFIRLHEKFSHKTMVLLTWGGLRGGISIALALSLPENLHQNLWLSVTYVVVAFSIIVQGLTISKVAEKQRIPSQYSSKKS